MKQILGELIAREPDFVELRYHKRTTNAFLAQKGRIDVAKHDETEGIGIRVLVNGAWGFCATSSLDRDAIRAAIAKARANARLIAATPGRKPIAIRPTNLAQIDYQADGYGELMNQPIAEKIDLVTKLERQLQKSSPQIQTASCRYNEIVDEKVIATTDGANCSLKVALPELTLKAIAARKGHQVVNYKSAGVAGGWQCLFKHPSLANVVDETAKITVDLLDAKYPDGGKKLVILSPAVVGLLCHEAVGHTVEADFVKAGSVAQGKIGTEVASPLVSMADSGAEWFAAGNIPFDDEGVPTTRTVIIESGILRSYLHNRESAAEFGVDPTGNARAWMFYDEPLIRMRNTFLLPGTSKLSEMIAGIDDGYLVEGAGGGQADSNGEFMFGATHLWHIKGGKKAALLREATLSGIAFDVLKTVDAVSSEFQWDLGSGYCGKGQPAKVDAGGPYVRCKISVGGRQE